MPTPRTSNSQPHRLIIVGGGAGGIELVTRLANHYRRRRRTGEVSITLVDQTRFHLWKPLLHEVAAGVLDAHRKGLNYAAHARRHGFDFCWGPLARVDRSKRVLTVGAVDDAYGNRVHAERELHYDTLVLAIGGTTNFFSVPGAEANAFVLDSVEDADRLRSTIVALCCRAGDAQDDGGPRVRLAIVGGGATGVELAAELSESLRLFKEYRLHKLDVSVDVSISLVEAGERILAPLEADVASEATARLLQHGVSVLTSSQVREVTERGLLFVDGGVLQADLVIWAAGVRAPPVLQHVDGISVGRHGHIAVHETLQAKNDPNVFALGDCAQCDWGATGRFVPPRAQAAHQQAAFLSKALIRRIEQGTNDGLPAFRYRDFGSLVSLGNLGAVGSLLGKWVGGKRLVAGSVAKFMYVSLHRAHSAALHGWPTTLLVALSHLIGRRLTPRVKLH